MRRAALPVLGLLAIIAALVMSAVSGGDGDGDGEHDGASPCIDGDLTIVAAREHLPGADGGQAELGLSVRTQTGHPCTIGGFPTVELIGRLGPDPISYVLPQSKSEFDTITLDTETSAEIIIRYFPSTASRPFPMAVDYIRVLPPDFTDAVIVGWAGSPIDYAPTATHPGTYAGPLAQPRAA